MTTMIVRCHRCCCYLLFALVLMLQVLPSRGSSFLGAAAATGTGTAGTPTLRQVSAMIPRHKFERLRRADTEADHEVVVAIAQQNMDVIERFVLDRATPEHASYLGAPMTFEQVGDLIANDVGYSAIASWLHSLPDAVVTWTSPRWEYIKVKAPLRTWEDALNARFHVYQDYTFPEDHPAVLVNVAESYSVPEALRAHITTIFNTVQVPPPFKKSHVEGPQRSSAEQQLHARGSETIFREQFSLHQIQGKELASGGKAQGSKRRLQDDAPQSVTVAFLNYLYDIPSNYVANVSMSQSVFSTNSQYFSPADLTLYQQTNDFATQACKAPFGYTTSACTTPSKPTNQLCDEGNLDVQYIMGVAQNVATIYWYVGTGDPFVSFVTQLASTKHPPLSNSISWGTWETQIDSGTMQSFNTEALKLAAMGGTITVSSGDDGAPNGGSSGKCLCNVDTSSNKIVAGWSGAAWSGYGYTPSFPASSPYVTAVGATMGPEIGNEEVTCQGNLGGVITSGGGFSVVAPAPAWQTKAIAKYFANIPKGQWPTSGYNPNGRGYPDISFIGVNYAVAIGGSFFSVFGTSASAPVLAGMVTLINGHRLAQGKSPIGFLNPTLYSLGHNSSNSFNDVTVGNSHCCAKSATPSCCPSGFNASVAWDPVTGWGSISFVTLAGVFGVKLAVHEPSTDPALYSEAFLVAGAILASTSFFFALFVCYLIYYAVFIQPLVNRIKLEQQANWGLVTDPADLLTEPIIRRDDNPLQPGPRTPPRNNRLRPDPAPTIPVYQNPALFPQVGSPPKSPPASMPKPLFQKASPQQQLQQQRYSTRPYPSPPVAAAAETTQADAGNEIFRRDNPLQPGPRTPPRSKKASSGVI